LEDIEGFIAVFPNLQSYRHSYVTSKWRKPLRSRRMYQALLQVKVTLREIWLHFPEQNFTRAEGLKWPTYSTFTVLELLHIPIFLLEDFKGERRTINLSELLPPTLKTLHIFDASYNTLPNLLPSLLDYINSPHSQNLTDITIATTPHYVEGGLIIILDEPFKRRLQLTDDPSRPDDFADPICQRLKELERACRRRQVKFDFQIFDHSSELARVWKFEDPFEETLWVWKVDR
jgi:hypothetical protein